MNIKDNRKKSLIPLNEVPTGVVFLHKGTAYLKTSIQGRGIVFNLDNNHNMSLLIDELVEVVKAELIIT